MRLVFFQRLKIGKMLFLFYWMAKILSQGVCILKMKAQKIKIYLN